MIVTLPTPRHNTPHRLRASRRPESATCEFGLFGKLAARPGQFLENWLSARPGQFLEFGGPISRANFFWAGQFFPTLKESSTFVYKRPIGKLARTIGPQNWPANWPANSRPNSENWPGRAEGQFLKIGRFGARGRFPLHRHVEQKPATDQESLQRHCDVVAPQRRRLSMCGGSLSQFFPQFTNSTCACPGITYR